MSTLTRREKQHIANREGILEAALELANREGWSAVTIRNIADEIDYTSPIIYQHFDNKEAALQVLMKRGYETLCRVMEASNQPNTPDEQLLNVGRSYLRFAKEQPRLYELMNGLSGVQLDPNARKTAALGVIAFVTQAVEKWASTKDIHISDPLTACETCWGILHGMASLGTLEDIGFDHAELLAVNALSALMKSWEVQS